MGTAMAANLAASGAHVTAYVRRPDQMQKLEALYLKPTTDFTSCLNAMSSSAWCRTMMPRAKSCSGAATSGSSASPRFNARRNPSFDEHNQHGTASQLASEHARYGQGYVAAPFLGSDCCQGTPVVHYRFRCSADVEICRRYSRRSGNRPS